MAKWLDIPNWGFSGHTDAQVVDAQAGMEADEITKLSMQLGANLNHDVGYMDFGLSGSLAEVVLVAEFISRNRQLLKPRSRSTTRRWPWTCSRPSAPAATSSASGTRASTCARSQWRGKILNRASYDRWAEGGALDATEKARRRALELLATHEVAPLPDGLAERLDAVVPAS